MAKKILIIDDESDLVETLSFRLEGLGFDIISAANGREGYEMAKKEKPDLILLDVMMPVMDGYRACELIRTSASLKATPIIMLTAKGQDSDRDVGISLGANDYVLKPFDPAELVAKIKKHIGG